ncbi:hypothetical protein IMZ48_49920, partial [Candidatus Bathyarchaeota archaeon]|nr:hypothetical protein [Candidatus Bathyarchaeota archaeon]
MLTQLYFQTPFAGMENEISKGNAIQIDLDDETTWTIDHNEKDNALDVDKRDYIKDLLIELLKRIVLGPKSFEVRFWVHARDQFVTSLTSHSAIATTDVDIENTDISADVVIGIFYRISKKMEELDKDKKYWSASLHWRMICRATRDCLGARDEADFFNEKERRAQDFEDIEDELSGFNVFFNKNWADICPPGEYEVQAPPPDSIRPSQG